VQLIPSITGTGLVTPLGRTARSTFDALLAGVGISDHTRLESDGDPDLPRVISIAMEAADEAIAQAGWAPDRRDVAVIACTSKGSIESWINSTVTRASGPCSIAPQLCDLSLQTTNTRAAHPCHDEPFGIADLSTHLARHIGPTDAPRLCLSSACASGLHGLIRGAMMIQSGEANRALIVAAEASVHPLFLGSFERLGVLAPAGGAGGTGGLCRPFDQNRTGFLMTEAAAAVCLEATDDPSRMIARIDRYAMGGDATHLTGSDPNGSVLRHLLGRVIGNQPMDLFHAHGTGTTTNDSTELSALENFAGEHDQRTKPLLYSHKAGLGHSLGASGLVATVLSCLCHQSGKVPGNINTEKPMPTQHVQIERACVTRVVRRSLIHAAGFGGPMALVSLVT